VRDYWFAATKLAGDETESQCSSIYLSRTVVGRLFIYLPARTNASKQRSSPTRDIGCTSTSVPNQLLQFSSGHQWM